MVATISSSNRPAELINIRARRWPGPSMYLGLRAGTASHAQHDPATLDTYGNLYGSLLDYVVFAVLIFYVLTIAGIFVLRPRGRTWNGPTRRLVIR